MDKKGSPSIPGGSPVWMNDNEVSKCPVCSSNFTFTRRKHHCRACGRVVCASCSRNRSSLPAYQNIERVCDNCFSSIAKNSQFTKESSSLESEASLQENEQISYELEYLVEDTYAMSHSVLQLVMENRALIQRNFLAVFDGNFHLSNSNTDAIFRNRAAIIQNLPEDGNGDPSKAEFRQIALNTATLDFLDHRSKLFAKIDEIYEMVNGVSEHLNKILIQVANLDIQDSQFHRDELEKNKQILQKGLPEIEQANPASLSNLIDQNRQKMDLIKFRVDENSKQNAAIHAKVIANRDRIEANTTSIYQRRAAIICNRGMIRTNSVRVINLFSNLEQLDKE